MKITSVAGPGQVQDLSTPEHVRTARMLAAATTSAPQAQEHPVANANKISPEEVSAIRPPAQEGDSPGVTEEAEAPAEVKDPEAERRFAQIARQEKALRAKIHQANLQLKQREEALKAREAAVQQPKEQDLSRYIDRERLKQDALSVLEEEGVDFNELTNQAINRQPTDSRVLSTIQKLEAKIAQLEEANKTSALTQTEREKAQYDAAIKQISNDVRHLVNTDPEFETVKAMKAERDVVDLIKRQHAKDGTILTVDEAAKMVEDYLIEEGMKITQIEKIKKRMAAANASQIKSEEKPQANQQRQPMKTLTNASSGTQKLSVRDRAIARANGHQGDF